jgi:hypothetical protein
MEMETFLNHLFVIQISLNFLFNYVLNRKIPSNYSIIKFMIEK